MCAPRRDRGHELEHKRAHVVTKVTRRVLLAAALSPPLAAAARTQDLGDAVDMRRQILSGETTSRELIEAAIGRLNRVNGQLNAITAKTYSAALERAAMIPDAVPSITKDNAPRAGELFTQGSRAYRSRVAEVTAPYLEAMDRAGFVSLARTTCPEFGLSPTTEPQLTGPTRNPWNLARSAGGSSGGSAALVAAGAVPVAHGNDGGGSLRIPAAACGVYALKPTRRPGLPHGPGGGGTASGCLSRTVRDSALWLHEVTQIAIGSTQPQRSLRIMASPEPPAGGSLDSSTARVYHQTVDLLMRMGHEVVEAATPYRGAAFIEAFLALYEANAARLVATFERDAGRQATENDFEPLTLGLAASGRAYSARELDEARAVIGTEASAYVSLFQNFDVFLSPVLSEPAALLGRFGPRVPYSRQRDDLITYATYTFIQNASNTPAAALPMGQSSCRLPIGMQICAAPERESTLIDLSLAIERLQPWAHLRPQVFAEP